MICREGLETRQRRTCWWWPTTINISLSLVSNVSWCWSAPVDCQATSAAEPHSEHWMAPHSSHTGFCLSLSHTCVSSYHSLSWRLSNIAAACSEACAIACISALLIPFALIALIHLKLLQVLPDNISTPSPGTIPWVRLGEAGQVIWTANFGILRSGITHAHTHGHTDRHVSLISPLQWPEVRCMCFPSTFLLFTFLPLTFSFFLFSIPPLFLSSSPLPFPHKVFCLPSIIYTTI